MLLGQVLQCQKAIAKTLPSIMTLSCVILSDFLKVQCQRHQGRWGIQPNIATLFQSIMTLSTYSISLFSSFRSLDVSIFLIYLGFFPFSTVFSLVIRHLNNIINFRPSLDLLAQEQEAFAQYYLLWTFIKFASLGVVCSMHCEDCF